MNKYTTFWKRIEKNFTKTDGCWLWKGTQQGAGYGVISFLAHRLVYELLVGPIPDSLVIDHLCNERSCVNPNHMRTVTQEVNSMSGGSPPARNARKKRCKHGHRFTAKNTMILSKGPNRRRARTCRICCHREQQRYRDKKRALQISSRMANSPPASLSL